MRALATYTSQITSISVSCHTLSCEGVSNVMDGPFMESVVICCHTLSCEGVSNKDLHTIMATVKSCHTLSCEGVSNSLEREKFEAGEEVVIPSHVRALATNSEPTPLYV